MSLRILVVDDTVLFRRVISDALAGIPGVEIAGSAPNGKRALAQLAALKPDLMTLDVEMPEMNGLEVLQAMKSSGSTTGVIVLSSHTSQGSAMAIRALELGAFELVTKPDGQSADDNLIHLRNRMMPVLRAFERSRDIRSILGGGQAKAPSHIAELPKPAGDSATAMRGIRRNGAPIILIGVSTGGPAALANLLPSFPADLRAPIFIAQHMPPHFTEALARSLQGKCAIRVSEAIDGETAAPGCAYIAPGGRHMKLAQGPRGSITINITDDPPENNCRPSVDYLFRSAALQFPGRSVAVVLTGMGNDGAQGLKMLKRGGCFSIAQDETTCVVFGMPREAIETGAVNVVAPLLNIAPAIMSAINGPRL